MFSSFRVLTVVFFLLPKLGVALDCYKNEKENDHRIESVCFLNNSEGVTKGFLLYNANGTKSYLKVYRHLSEGDALHGAGTPVRTVSKFVVQSANSELEVQERATSMIYMMTGEEETVSIVHGETPGGRKFWFVINHTQN